MKLKKPEFKKNKIEQGRYYTKFKEEPLGIIYMDPRGVVLTTNGINNLFTQMNKILAKFPNHEIRVVSEDLGRII